MKHNDTKEEDARIIIGSFGENAARQVFCEAYRLGLYGPRYVWMILGQYTDRWWTVGNNTNCTVTQLSMAVSGLFTVDALNALLGENPSTSGLKTDEFLGKYTSLGLPSPRSPYAPQTYDTVWAVALTLREAILREAKIYEFTYNSGIKMKNMFKNIVENLEFFGVSGPVSFEGPDRRGVTVLQQNQGGKMVRLALCYPDSDTLDFQCPGCQPVLWQGKGGKVPNDKTNIKSYMKVIQVTAFNAITGISCFGITMALVFLSFNLFYRKLKYIKLSSPRLNNVAVIGCIWVYLAVILLGFDERNIPEAFSPAACTVRAFLFAAGFSLSFGAMFTKTYRVHHICSRASSGLVIKKLLKDKQLLFIVGALLIVDIFIISLWAIVDPMQRQVLNFTEEISKEDPDVIFVPQLSRCYSIHIQKWTGALYTYKGLLLIFGVYMAWSTRHVKIPALNDSQYIGFSVYNVVIMSVIVVVLSNILTNEPTMSYLIISSCILLSTMATLCLLFLPKIYTIVKMGGNHVITTSGLTVEANTRRFIVDDRKEMYYRAEVQNRIFNREIRELYQEISRLELLSEMPASPRYHKKDEYVLIYPPDKRSGKPENFGKGVKSEIKQLDQVTDEEDISDLPDVCAGHFADRKQQMDKEDSGIYTMSFKSNRSCMLQPIESTCSIDEETELTEIEGLKEELLNEYRLRNFSSEFYMYSEMDSHVVRGTNRRQTKYEGTQHERQSLLRHCEQSPTENTCALVFGRTCPTGPLGNDLEMTVLTSSGARKYVINESTKNVGGSHDKQDQGSRIRACTFTPSVEVTPPPEEGDRGRNHGGDAKGIRKSRSEQEKIQVEFSKIKRQLKSLGDLQVEVVHV
ncbi:gamma-aminobutyric acid type B receptor subunit 2-like isoform X2 [Lineus longissimus]|uniref:gamma-aminobutyric acid type B receptor subunit 2-like isoform X2 n=1 Tax=Lineus longissimus TaxID=88925 RepID=UPI00315CD133